MPSVNKETKKHLITRGVPLKLENTETLYALPSVPENKGTELQRKGNEPHSWAHVTQYIPLHNLIVEPQVALECDLGFGEVT